MRYKALAANVKVRGRYSVSQIKQMVEFKCKFTYFCDSKTIRAKAYVDEKAVVKHDIVFGQRFCTELGLVLDF